MMNASISPSRICKAAEIVGVFDVVMTNPGNDREFHRGRIAKGRNLAFGKLVKGFHEGSVWGKRR
jgi:hypothetical protein